MLFHDCVLINLAAVHYLLWLTTLFVCKILQNFKCSICFLSPRKEADCLALCLSVCVQNFSELVDSGEIFVWPNDQSFRTLQIRIRIQEFFKKDSLFTIAIPVDSQE